VLMAVYNSHILEFFISGSFKPFRDARPSKPLLSVKNKVNIRSFNKKQ